MPQTLGFGNETFICYDVLWRPHRTGEVISPDPAYVNLECRTESRDFAAGFYGERSDLPTFYHVLGTMQGP